MIRARIEQLWYAGAIGLWLYELREEQGVEKVYVAKPMALDFQYVGESGGYMQPDPTIKLSTPRAQSFMQSLCDALAEMGYRPNTDRIAGKLEGVEAHLKREQGFADRLLAIVERGKEP